MSIKCSLAPPFMVGGFILIVWYITFLGLSTEWGLMELCSIEEAFPNIGDTKSSTPFAGGKDSYASREERRAARKLAKKRKGAPAEKYAESVKADIPDPDRPAVERMESVDTVQKEKEAFALPVLPKASCLFSETGGSTYFGKWAEDDDVENFSTFSPSPTDDANYRLYPDFTKGDVLKGAAKAAGQGLPEPPMNDQWKPMTGAASYTAYYTENESTPAISETLSGTLSETLSGMLGQTPSPMRSQEPSPTKKAWNQEPENTKGPVGVNDTQGNGNDALLKRIDDLMGRLDDLEKKNVRDSQTEILMFVGTGLFILVSFEILTRR